LARLAESEQNKLQVDEINVRVINIVDGHGTRRMSLFDADHKPEICVGGQEFPGLRQGYGGSGISFYNGQGDECGGLVFGSQQLPDGKYEQGLMLAFDAFQQDQMLYLSASDTGGKRDASLEIWHRPKHSILEDLHALQEAKAHGAQAKTEEVRRRMFKEHFRRLSVGMSEDGAVAVTMNDSRGRTRIRIVVDSQDCPRIEILDEAGEVVYSLPPAPKAG
jgi:hypothetical protein